MRTAILRGIISLLFLSLVMGLFTLEMVQGKRFRELSDKNYIRVWPQIGMRGRIIDTRGEIIVDNMLSYDAVILVQGKQEMGSILKEVSRILGVTPDDLNAAHRENFVSQSIPVAIARNISLRKAIALEEQKMDVDGIVIQPHPQRDYPYGSLGCHMIGYLGEIDHWRLTKLADYGYKTKDLVGYTGLEEKYDYYLRQEEGGFSVEVNHRGRFVRVLGFKQPRNGKDIQLTIDVRVQKIVENLLQERKGSVILMQPETGEIIALTNSPRFDPAVFVQKSNSAIAELFRNPDAVFLNRAISGVYPAASVFKLVTAAAALETGKMDLDKTFFCSGKLRIGNKEYGCWDTHAQENLIDAIAHSCDVFFYHTGLLVGGQVIHDYALKLGYGKPTAIDLPYEASGFVPDPLWKKIHRLQSWYDGDTANLSIGQGELLVTPLQVARMMAVFANRGTLVTPYIVKAVDGKDRSVSRRKAVKVPLKKDTIEDIRQGLRGVVADPDGTGNVLSSLPIVVAGKTGTAQVSRGQPHAWFSGFFPFDKPKFVLCVFLENGGSGQAACVLAKHIIEEMIKEGIL